MMPGSPERVLLRNPYLTQEKIEQVREEWGLDKPLVPDQLVGYIGDDAQGDLGYSLKFRGQPVTEVIGSHFWPTIILVGLARGHRDRRRASPLGAYAGLETRRPGDRVGNGARPDPLLDAVLRDRHAADHHLRGRARLVPDLGDADAGRARTSRSSSSSLDFLRHLVLPLATVALGLIGGYSILMRSSIIETRSEDYVTTARAKGLRRPDPAPARVPERAAADGHDHRHQPRLRRRRARSRPRSSSTGRASGR